jgi:predicted enzyme related to lactoylglutathione lyase
MATVQSSIATGMDAVYYLTKDFARARTFYEGALGMRPTWEDSSEGGQWVEYQLADGTTFGLGHMPGSEFHPSGGIMFAVPDVKDALSRVKDAGAGVVFDYLETPVCHMAWCVDSEGNTFCLHHRTVS